MSAINRLIGRRRTLEGAALPSSTLNSGLTGFWTLDEASGTRADSVGSYDFTVLTGTPGSAAGLVDNAITYDGTSSIRGANSAGYIDGSTDWSLSFWVKFDAGSIGNGKFITSVWGGSGRSWALEKNSSDNLVIYHSSNGSGTSGSTELTSTPTISSGTWYHVVLVHDVTAQTITGYFNGSGIGSHSGDLLANAPYGFAIGSLGNSGSLIGAMDIMAFWQRQLTAEEITELYGKVQNQPY